MRRCRKAEASGSSIAHGALPEELKPFLEILAEMLAEAVLRERRASHFALGPDAPGLNHHTVGLESAPEESREESEEA
jgi:hypothetical protein